MTSAVVLLEVLETISLDEVVVLITESELVVVTISTGVVADAEDVVVSEAELVVVIISTGVVELTSVVLGALEVVEDPTTAGSWRLWTVPVDVGTLENVGIENPKWKVERVELVELPRGFSGPLPGPYIAVVLEVTEEEVEDDWAPVVASIVVLGEVEELDSVVIEDDVLVSSGVVVELPSTGVVDPKGKPCGVVEGPSIECDPVVVLETYGRPDEVVVDDGLPLLTLQETG